MNPQIDSLQKRVAELEKTLLSLNFSSQIPRNVQTALEQRINVITAGTPVATGGTTSYGSFPVVVPAVPSGALLVTVNGTTYKLLYV